MTPWTKFTLTVFGIALAASGVYWQIHQNDQTFGARFWIGLAFAPAGSLGAYLVGLFQSNPFNPDERNPVPKP